MIQAFDNFSLLQLHTLFFWIELVKSNIGLQVCKYATSYSILLNTFGEK
jgi:hypothetical protein